MKIKARSVSSYRDRVEMCIMRLYILLRVLSRFGSKTVLDVFILYDSPEDGPQIGRNMSR
jgi:hypothetical protein